MGSDKLSTAVLENVVPGMEYMGKRKIAFPCHRHDKDVDMELLRDLPLLWPHRLMLLIGVLETTFTTLSK